MCCLSKTRWITVLFQVLSTRVFQELKKQVETAVELEKKLKVELKKKDKDLKTAQDVNKVCFFILNVKTVITVFGEADRVFLTFGKILQ